MSKSTEQEVGKNTLRASSITMISQAIAIKASIPQECEDLLSFEYKNWLKNGDVVM